MSDEPGGDGKKAKRPGGWGVGFLFAALVFYFVVDESDPEAVANLPAVVSFVVLVVGKAGLIYGSVALGIGLTVWEFCATPREQRREEPAAGKRRPVKPKPRRAAAVEELPFAEPIPDDEPVAPGLVRTPAPKLRPRFGGVGGLRKGNGGTADEETPPPVPARSETTGGAPGMELSSAKYLGRGE